MKELICQFGGLALVMTFKVSMYMCNFCQKNLPTHRKQPLIIMPLPERAWKKTARDLCKHEGKQFLVIIGHYSRFPDIAYMSTTTNDAVINNSRSYLPDGEYLMKL